MLSCKLFLHNPIFFSSKLVLGVKLLKTQYQSNHLPSTLFLCCLIRLLPHQPSVNYLWFTGCHQGPSAFPARDDIDKQSPLAKRGPCSGPYTPSRSRTIFKDLCFLTGEAPFLVLPRWIFCDLYLWLSFKNYSLPM